MKKVKQILAILGVVLILGLFVLTMVAAIFDPTESMNYFMASMVATIMVPLLIWMYLYMSKMVKKNKDENEDL